MEIFTFFSLYAYIYFFFFQSKYFDLSKCESPYTSVGVRYPCLYKAFGMTPCPVRVRSLLKIVRYRYNNQFYNPGNYFFRFIYFNKKVWKKPATIRSRKIKSGGLNLILLVISAHAKLKGTWILNFFYNIEWKTSDPAIVW